MFPKHQVVGPSQVVSERANEIADKEKADKAMARAKALEQSCLRTQDLPQ